MNRFCLPVGADKRFICTSNRRRMCIKISVCCSKKRHLSRKAISRHVHTRYVIIFLEIGDDDIDMLRACYGIKDYMLMIIAALTGIMVWFQRCLIFILAEILVQVSVHAFVVILWWVIHSERLCFFRTGCCWIFNFTAKLFYVSEFQWITLFVSHLRHQVCKIDEGFFPVNFILQRNHHITLFDFIFIIVWMAPDAVTSVSFAKRCSVQWVSQQFRFHNHRIQLQFLFLVVTLSPVPATYRFARRRFQIIVGLLRKNSFKQLTNKSAKWAFFLRLYFGSGGSSFNKLSNMCFTSLNNNFYVMN